MLIYLPICSLDGYVNDADGGFSWAAPSEEVHAAVNGLERRCSTMILGRRTYEVLAVWETMDVSDASPALRDFSAIWHATDKVVVSRTLDDVATSRTTLVRELEPPDGECSIGGPTLAAEALRRGLVDEVHLFLTPIVVGAGTPALPPGRRMRLTGQRAFPDGVVQLSYTP